MNNKNIFLWSLYDFANSIVTITFFLYFSQWLVVENGVSDFSYNMIYVAGSALLLLTAPVFGSIADKNGKQQRYLNKITIITFVFFLLASITTLFWSKHVFMAALFFLFANYFYQFSFVFYNALLHAIASPEKQGRISGIGQAGNWLGQIVGLLVTLPLAGGAVYLFGAAGRAQTFLPATILFLLLALPMLLQFKVQKNSNVAKTYELVSVRQEYKNQWSRFVELLKSPGMKLFLLAYFFFNDAIITVLNNFPIYLQRVFHINDKTKSMLFIGILFTSVIGALFSGWISDKIGLRKTLMIVLGSWIIVLPVVGLTHNFSLFVVFAVIVGFLFGSIWTVTRATMLTLCPKDKLNFGFSFYTLAERVSTFVGPLLWGILTSMVSFGENRYRIAMISMTLFVIVGVLLLRKIPKDLSFKNLIL